MAKEQPVILRSDPAEVRINIDDGKPKKAKEAQYLSRTPAKQSFGTKMKHAFLGPDVDNAGDYILNEYLVPTGKRMVNNASQNILKKIGDGIQFLLFGKVIQGKERYEDFTSYSKPNQGQGQTNTMAYKVADAVDTFALTNEKAHETLAYLRGRIREYGSTSVLDYYEYIGAPMDYTLSDRGWKNLDSATIKPMPGTGFYIDLPRPIFLKKGG